MVDLVAEHNPFTMDFGGSEGLAYSEGEEEDEQDGVRSTDRKAGRAGGGGRVWDVTLEKLRARLQIPPDGPFDRTDIAWKGRTNNGCGRLRETFRAIIPWDGLGDFVEGEQSMRDFPCTFNEVPSLGYKAGQAENAKETSFLQKIK